MRIKVKVSGGSTGMFSAASSTTEVLIDGSDFEMGQATVAVLSILSAHGIDEGDGLDPSDGETEVAEMDGAEHTEAMYQEYPPHRGAVLFDPSFKSGYVVRGELSHAGVANFIEGQEEKR